MLLSALIVCERRATTKCAINHAPLKCVNIKKLMKISFSFLTTIAARFTAEYNFCQPQAKTQMNVAINSAALSFLTRLLKIKEIIFALTFSRMAFNYRGFFKYLNTPRKNVKIGRPLKV
jgi:hypothetical protein